MYWEPSELAKVRLFDYMHSPDRDKEADIIQALENMYEQVGQCLVAHTTTFTTFGHDTKALPANLTYAGDLNLPLFPKHQPKKVKWVETHLNKALRERYSDRQRHVLLPRLHKILTPKSPREETTEGQTGYSV